MTRITTATNPSPKAQELLGMVKQKLGRVPNMLQTLAHSPAALEFYVAGSGALGGSAISAQDRERIALLTATTNSCKYCSAAHTAIGKGAGLSDADVEQSKHGKAADPKSNAILSLTAAILSKKGHLSDDDIKAARAASINDGEALEIVGAVALNIFTNYVNHIADPVIDF